MYSDEDEHSNENEDIPMENVFIINCHCRLLIMHEKCIFRTVVGGGWCTSSEQFIFKANNDDISSQFSKHLKQRNRYSFSYSTYCHCSSEFHILTNYPCYPSVLHTAHTHRNEKRLWLLCNHKIKGVHPFLFFSKELWFKNPLLDFFELEATWRGMAWLGLAWLVVCGSMMKLYENGCNANYFSCQVGIFYVEQNITR